MGKEVRSIASNKVTYRDGMLLPYLGSDYQLEVREYLSYKKPAVKLEGNKIVVLIAREEPEQIKAAVKNWYLKQAREIIPKRVEHYREELQETVSAVRIKDVKSRWGSCSSKRNLNFNWRLILAPMEAMDYVVVHELCHLKEMNHSKAFWKLVEEVLPDYEKPQKWLRECHLIERYE